MIMVDEIQNWPNVKHRCFQKGFCHLTTDGDLGKLHAFAAGIGLRREWFQDHPLAPHYDLSIARRTLAIRAGAVEISARDQARARIAARRLVNK